MPGYGPKAEILKWLDTGKVDYQDLYGWTGKDVS